MSDQPVTNPSLLVRLRDPADSPAWGVFSELYEPLIYAYCRKRGLQEADARDLTQEVICTVIQAIRGFDYNPAHGRFRGWLYGVVRMKLMEYYRRSSKQPKGSGKTVVNQMLNEQPDSEDSEEFEKSFRRRVMLWACDRIEHEFEPQTWKAFWLTTIEGRKPADTADTLSVSITVVYNAKSRVVKRLQQVIHETSEWDE